MRGNGLVRGVRVPERIYTVVLWIVSIIFAGFIIGFGNLLIGDLPQVEQNVTQDQFVETEKLQEINAAERALQEQSGSIEDKLDTLRPLLDQARSASRTGTETFEAWVKTRTATTNPAQDSELLARTRELEQLKANERAVQTQIDELENELVPIRLQLADLSENRYQLEDSAYPAFERAQFWQDLRIFGLRLLLTLPMLVIAAWMIWKKRQSDYWPLARGFVLAAIFVFFVELVPYLPSYGGYVRYGVGIILTFAAGHFLIKHMRQYLENRREVEAQAEQDRRKLVSHDEAFKKMAAKVCPGCDRPTAAMEGTESNFCVHCGMTLFDHCRNCDVRKMAFFRFCMACGTNAEDADQGNDPPAPTAEPA